MAIARALCRQRALERHWRAQPASPITFESRVEASNLGGCHHFGRVDQRPNCAATLRCWASLFLSAPQMNTGTLYGLVSGGAVSQLYDNPNVALFLALRKAVAVSGRQLPPSLALAARSYCQRQARLTAASLRETLLADDDDDYLPRVFFCSLTWVLQSGLRLQSVAAEADLFSGTADHEFALVKRRAAGRVLEFQLVHGYSDSEDEPGFALLEWQRSGHPLASLEGFGAPHLEQFIARLCTFAAADVWDGQSFCEAFGRTETVRGAGHTPSDGYWPAISFRELTDDAIVGWGPSPLLDHLEGTCFASAPRTVTERANVR